MLNIEVFEKYRITSDEFNVMIHERVIVDPTKSPNWERRKAEGASPNKRIEWRVVSYHASVEQALQKLAELKIRESDATTLTELLHDIKRIRREISDVLTVRV